ncbi:na+ h+ antiporter [Levilactobacillus koreensis JCM 16448]|uniref:Na+/H+ antiporter NhaC family protein n=1 Tax=Levilactobacillus koreensis TaxID=637971 RepID=UPI0006EFFA5F|nr:Na+/H+ antiporter NhaC family protein [Levilactobacillus koreensis]KRK91804.1 na+ h+ antiporter [Levilactobacillus koreensis JCM 16448]
MEEKKKTDNHFSLIESLIIMVIMFLILGTMIIGMKMSPQIPILFVFTLLMFYGHFRKISWEQIFDGITEGIKPGIIPILIFLMIGLLVSSWLASGTIATIMVIGFNILSVKFFLPTVFVICGLVGITVGSSFTTVSTMGIAFMGIGHILGFSDALTGGAIVSGALLGNNLSPLSDTSNLTTGLTKVNLYRHLLAMAGTIVPSAIIALGLYFVMGSTAKTANLSQIQSISSSLEQSFAVSAWSLLPILVLLLLAWRQVPAIPSLLLGSITALLLVIVRDPSYGVTKISNLLMMGNIAKTPSTTVNELMSGGGINNMLGSVSLIIVALALGGLLIKFGVVHTLIDSIKPYVNKPGKLILFTELSGVGVNLMVGEQYLSIILPGTTFKSSYDRLGLDRKYLSRTLATGGADINALVPWGVSGIFFSGTLNVDALQYIPMAFYTYINPIMTIIAGFTFVTWRYKKQLAQAGSVEAMINQSIELDDEAKQAALKSVTTSGAGS